MTSVYHFRDISIPKDVYLDTNFVIDFSVKPPKSKRRDYRLHRNASELMERLIISGVNIYISLLVLNEMWFRLARYFYDLKQGKGSWYNEKDKGAICKQFSSELESAIKDLLDIPRLKFIPSKDHEIITKSAIDYIKNYPLVPADALHISTAQSENISCIITNDKHFKQIRDPNLIIITF